MKLKQFSKVRWFSAALSGLLLAGCGGANVRVGGDFPQPLAREIPLNAGVCFDEDFRNYTYTNARRVSIAMGDSQVELFQVIIGGMFRDMAVLDAVPQGESDVDIVIAPYIEQVQLAVPRDTQLQVYEVWIKYNIRVFDGAGTPIADWVMTSYGKAVNRLLSSSEAAINQASVMALRDVGAQLVAGFALVPEVQQWLETRLAMPVSGGGGV